MRTNYVLIDFENVQPTSLAGLDADHFRVLVLVGANQNKLSFDTAAAMQRLGGRAEYVKIAGSGSNALDFHIAFHAGHLAAQDPAAFFHIISKDPASILSSTISRNAKSSPLARRKSRRSPCSRPRTRRASPRRSR